LGVPCKGTSAAHWGEAEWLEGKSARKIIFVKNKMINVVIYSFSLKSSATRMYPLTKVLGSQPKVLGYATQMFRLPTPNFRLYNSSV
jgi:hypothetical protein